MAQPKLKHLVSANTWIRQMEFLEKGSRMEGHIHTFDHQTLFATGEFIIKVEDKKYKIQAPHVFITKAGMVHEIECVSDTGLAYCIHALRKGENIEDIASPDEICEGWHHQDTMPLRVGGSGETFYKSEPKVGEVYEG